MAVAPSTARCRITAWHSVHHHVQINGELYRDFWIRHGEIAVCDEVFHWHCFYRRIRRTAARVCDHASASFLSFSWSLFSFVSCREMTVIRHHHLDALLKIDLDLYVLRIDS